MDRRTKTNVTIGENKLPLDEIVDELASSDVNKTLGRRFKIVSFKRLNEKSNCRNTGYRIADNLLIRQYNDKKTNL
ncbi:MAG: hypothetical protein ACLUKN_00615 [Bacilli bacterium]